MKPLSIKIIIALYIIIASCNSATSSKSEEKLANKDSADLCLKPVAASDTAKFISKQIIIKGDVEREVILTVDSLKKMQTKILNNLNVVCQTGITTFKHKTKTGVLLKDIIDKAGIKKTNHKDRNFVIVARATDNYKATFSWAEIYNNPTGENTYVLFEEDGQPIKTHGDMKLICANDIKTGPRQVIWLKSIEINRIN
ncbi:MAG TPA: molybdopterin-dependent oxidoreductase [Chitinophagaceae bacterium]|nr:molybdopterin-dependent oxidoreductase [Chitinophagaceae bacterium]HNF30492.1 molybdopterin-dependent oxidoreductase [Chitinophagaceae bacterium]HNJ57825.1 molybdopterin-dependent oxidoreductase [Chitinophagaceae bacterium]